MMGKMLTKIIIVGVLAFCFLLQVDLAGVVIVAVGRVISGSILWCCSIAVISGLYPFELLIQSL